MDKIKIQCVQIHTWVIIKKCKEVIIMGITVVVSYLCGIWEDGW